MKKIIFLLFIFSLQLSIFNTASAQKTGDLQPDAEYNLIRRTYKTNADGSMDIRIRKELKLIRNRAITAYADKGETFIEYNPAFETVTVNECYTVRADGSRVNTPENAFIHQLPSSCTDCGRLNGIRELAIVHTALEYNCTIVLDYTLHRNSTLLTERFNLKQDCPVKRYEIRYADGHTDSYDNLPQTVNEPYMPAQTGFDVEFQLGPIPQYTAETSLPEARNTLAKLKQSTGKATVTAIRDWVVDYVHLNPVDLARVNYAVTPAREVFLSNCGTVIDRTLLLAAMLNEAGFTARILNNSISVFGDKPLEVEVTIDGLVYRINTNDKEKLLTDDERAVANDKAPVYVDRKLEWKPDTLADGYVRITLPDEPDGINIKPALLTPTRTSHVQTSKGTEFYHYTIEMPRGAKMVGEDVNIDYTLQNVGSINIIIKQKGNRLLITRSLRILKSDISNTDYKDFRQLMGDWSSHREILIKL